MVRDVVAGLFSKRLRRGGFPAGELLFLFCFLLLGLKVRCSLQVVLGEESEKEVQASEFVEYAVLGSLQLNRGSAPRRLS